jgi:hypothetical protein
MGSIFALIQVRGILSTCSLLSIGFCVSDAMASAFALSQQPFSLSLQSGHVHGHGHDTPFPKTKSRPGDKPQNRLEFDNLETQWLLIHR